MSNCAEKQAHKCGVRIGDVMFCERCKREIIRKTVNQGVCDGCRPDVKREYYKERARELYHTPSSVRVGEMMECEECEKPCVRTSPAQIHCPSCREYLKSVKRTGEKCRGRVERVAVKLIPNCCPHCGRPPSIKWAFRIWTEFGVKYWKCLCSPTETLTWDKAIIDI